MFPTLLLLNHSCEPNTLRINTNGNRVLMVAKRKIKKGEEITDNYGIHHLRWDGEGKYVGVYSKYCIRGQRDRECKSETGIEEEGGRAEGERERAEER